MRYWFRRSTTRQWIVAVLSLLIGGGALVAALLTSFDLGGTRQVQGAAQANDHTLLEDEFKRMLKRRTMYLLLLVALSVVIGVLGNLLYVMVGSALLQGTL